MLVRIMLDGIFSVRPTVWPRWLRVGDFGRQASLPTRLLDVSPCPETSPDFVPSRWGCLRGVCCVPGLFQPVFRTGPVCVKELRQTAVTWMENHPDRFLPSHSDESPSWPEYLATMRSEGVWGDTLTLQALSDVLRRRIRVVGTRSVVLSEPIVQGPDPDVILAYEQDVHYDAVIRGGLAAITGGVVDAEDHHTSFKT